MAYDCFPKTTKELQEKTKRFEPEVQGELFLLFDHLKKKYPKLETPINLDLSKPKSVNVSRAIEEDTTIRKIQSAVKISKIKMKFGNGSSGNRGVNNRGNLFEPQFAEAMLKWWDGNNVTDTKILDAILDLEKTYKISKWKKLVVDVVGGENTRRPIQYGTKLYLDNPKGQGYDVGKSVTDITIHDGKKNHVYLSLKLGTTTTFFNVGIKKVIPVDDIKAYNIKDPKGIQLLDAFGLDHKLFCDVFNQRLEKPVTVRSRNNKLDELLKTGIGEGYHIIHKMSGKIISKQMDRSALMKAAKLSGPTMIYYGGKTGTGRRIDMEMESASYKFKLNMRDTQGKDGYPSRLMCDFSYK